MSPDSSRKCKALFFLAILAVAEGRRVSYQSVRSRDETVTSNEPQGPEALEQEPVHVRLELDLLSRDPAFRQQLEAMAGHMDAFAQLVVENPRINARAIEIAKELFALSADPNSAENSMLPQQMEAMIADLDFQEVAQMVAEDMQTSIKENTEFQDELEAAKAAMSSEQASALVAEKVTEVMSDPDFQQRQVHVSDAMESLMQDADLQREAEKIAAFVDGSHGPEAAQKVSEQMDAVMTDANFREKAHNAILEMLSAEVNQKMNSPEGFSEAELQELQNIAQNPTPEVLEAMNNLKRAMKGEQSSLLELGESDDEASTSAKPLLSALMTTMNSAFNAGAVSSSRPALGSRAPQAARGLGPRMGLSDAQPETQPSERMFQGAEQERSALTSAKGIRSMLPSLAKALPRWGKGAVMEAKKNSVDVALLLCFALWYLGNYYYNISNKLALVAAGGAAGFPMSIATLQLGVGVIYALFLWIAPDARTKPTISFKDWVATFPVGMMTAGAHAASVFALGAGAVSFAQIVKAAEPAFAAVIGTLAYGVTVSTAKWLSLIPVIGGVCLASLGELNFAWGALVTASLANVFAAIKGNENKKLMSTPGIADRLGTVENQFAVTTINAFLFTLPLMLLTEGKKLGQFVELMKTSPVLFNNVLSSGLWFYLYNELATKTIKKTNAVTQSVANTAKRVIVIVVVALVMQEGLSPLKLIGSGIGIGGVFLYSIIDKLVAGKKKEEPAPAPAPAPPPAEE